MISIASCFKVHGIGIIKMFNLVAVVYVFILTYSQDSLAQSTDGCSGLQEGSEGVIKSPNYPRSYPLKEYCTWIIKALANERVILNFEFFSLEESPTCEYDYVLIRDGSTPLSPIIGKFCGTSKPARITSTGQWLWMDFISDVSVSKQGFLVKWSSTSSLPKEPLPKGPDCGGEINADEGTLVSPGYPQKYPPGVICKWTLTVSNQKVIRLHFLSFSLEDDNLCRYDYLEIREIRNEEGFVFGRYCGDKKPPSISSSKNKLLITFLSNSDNTDTGFRASWEAVEDHVIEPKECGGILTGSYGTVVSPNYPQEYPPNLDCEWIIRASGVITWKFEAFHLEEDYQCRYDFVDIRDGQSSNARQLAFLCGRYSDEISKTINSTTNYLYIRFHSDKGKSGSGFRASWTAPLPTTQPTSKLVTLPPTTPITEMQGCGGRFTAEEGSLLSPNYPRNYPDNLDCTWTVEVSSGKFLAVTFNDFELEGESQDSCKYDYITIRDGILSTSPILDKYCGNTIPSLIRTSDNKLRITFHSDKSTAGRGFEATWISVQKKNTEPVINDTSSGAIEGCGKPLLENLSDKNFEVSSTWYSSSLFGGHRARLNLNNWPSGWVAAKEDSTPQLTIDLETEHVINAIATQGYDRAPRWVTRYKLMYKMIGQNGELVYYRSRGDGYDKIFKGNSDSKSIVRNEFDVPIVTSKVVVKPMTWYGAVGLRLELYGCKLEKSEQPLGLLTGRVSDSKLSASSTWNDDPRYGAHRARLNIGSFPQGWRASAEDQKPWIQVEFDEEYIITLINTQGYGGQEANWIKSYEVHWSKDGKTWQKSAQAFLSNSDRNTVEQNFFLRPIRAKWIRLHPLSWHSNVGLRMELYGYKADGPDKLRICQRIKKSLIGESQPPLQHSCGWTLNGYATYDIELKFNTFDFGVANCATDYVELFSGQTNLAPSLGKYCSGNDPTKLTFISMESVRIQYASSGKFKTNFKISYKTKIADDNDNKLTFPDMINEETCGKSRVDTGDIAPGAPPGAWPWQAALMLKGNQVQTCGGSLIARSWIIAAAHCFDRINDPAQWIVRMGEWDIKVQDGYEQDIKIKRIIIHSMYNKSSLESDIALIELTSQALLTSRVNTICLPDEIISKNIYVGRVCTTSGWGVTEFLGNPEAPLFSVEVPIVSREVCNSATSYNGQLPKGVLCAGKRDGRDDSCQGDGGGPLMCKMPNGAYVLAGVTSWGVGCALPEKYGVYTDVTQYMYWISDFVGVN